MAGARDARDVAERLIAEGNAYEDAGKLELALDCYRDAATAAPELARAHMNAGNALEKLQRPDEALAESAEAVRRDPAFAPARFNLGRLLLGQKRFEAAERELREALRIDGALVDATILLADALQEQDCAADAERELRRALEQRPDHAGAAINLARLLLQDRRYDEAEQWLFRAMDRNLPLVIAVLTNILTSLSHRDEADDETIYRTHLWIGRSIERSAGPPFRAWPSSADADRRLRIGYVSGDFREHPIALFMRPVLRHHDSERFEIFCYSTFGEPNASAQELRELVPHWAEVSRLGDEALVQRIRTDAIDILVDLSGHTDHNRLHVFARQPAPVQATWLGYLNTTGLRAMQWRICDRHTDPDGETDRFNTERLLRMPYSQWCYLPARDIAPIANPHAGEPHALVFGSHNQPGRISDSCLALWCRVLERVPHARIKLLGVRDWHTRDGLLRAFAGHGIGAERVETCGRLPMADYLTAIGNVDVALDTWPYNGATTTLNTLWMGVPVVALRGRRGISRGTYSIVRSLALKELTAESEHDYVELNVRLAHDADWRGELRATLRDRMSASPLMDGKAFVSALEAGYRHMWQSWCASRRAAPMPRSTV